MKKTLFTLSLVAFASLMLASCVKDKTTYRIVWSFDNTEMQTDLVKAFECIDGKATGKWRCDFHNIEFVIIDGAQHEMVSGHIDDVATGGANELWVYAEGDRERLHDYRLDTIFHLTPGEDNVFTITPDMIWLDD